MSVPDKEADENIEFTGETHYKIYNLLFRNASAILITPPQDRKSPPWPHAKGAIRRYLTTHARQWSTWHHQLPQWDPPYVVLAFSLANDHIQEIDFIVNPDKLRGISPLA
jgi:hypothetical protein